MAIKHAFLLSPLTVIEDQSGDLNATRNLDSSRVQHTMSLEMYADKSKSHWYLNFCIVLKDIMSNLDHSDNKLLKLGEQ